MKIPQSDQFKKYSLALQQLLYYPTHMIGNVDSYSYRITDNILKKYIEIFGAVKIMGSRWCGKTTTAEQLAKSAVYLNDPIRGPYFIEQASIDPYLILDREKPCLIDEWQLAPELWDAVRFYIDRTGGKQGQFILTGSATPLSKKSREKIHHTGTGRIANLMMRPMTLFESGDSNGKVSLRALFNGENIYCETDRSLEKIAWICCRGGWPQACTRKDLDDSALFAISKQYIESICNSEIPVEDSFEVNPVKMRQLFRSYARNIGTQIPMSVLEKDINISTPLSKTSLFAYKKTLDESFVTEDAMAWNVNLRSRTAIRTSETRYFVDPSIATAALGCGPNDLITHLKTFGFIFENLCIRDLRVYSQLLDGDVFHYRDSNNLECDAVIHLQNGSYGLIEVKLGGEANIEKGAASLKKLASIIDEEKMGKPSFLMVLVAVAPFAYRRADGVFVVPINTLGP